MTNPLSDVYSNMNTDELSKQIEETRAKLAELMKQLGQSKKRLFDYKEQFSVVTNNFLDKINALDISRRIQLNVRTNGEYAYNGLYLGSDCQKDKWVIVKDSEGYNVLTLERFVEKPKTFIYAGHEWIKCDRKRPEGLSNTDMVYVVYDDEFSEGQYSHIPLKAAAVAWSSIIGYKTSK